MIIVDDLTRPTPKKAILTCLMDHLHEYGVRNAQIDVLIGLGTHRPLAQAEIEDTFGRQLSKEIRFINHDCHSRDLVSIGKLRFGGDLRVHPLAVKADLRIAIGSILPHPFAGFGGGAKLVLPGIADYEFIREHHMALMTAQGVELGNTIGTRFITRFLEAARLAKLDFIINAVYDAREEVKAIVAGHFETAHESGLPYVRERIGGAF